MFFEDGDNVRRNRVTMLSSRPGWNAMVSYQITEPETVVEPVTVQEAKDFSHVDYNDDDAKIGRLITAARGYIQRYTGVFLIPVQVVAEVRNELGGINLFPFPARNIKDSVGNDINISDAWSDVKTIAYDGGHEPADVPEIFKTAILMQVDFNLNGGLGFSPEVREMLRQEVVI